MLAIKSFAAHWNNALTILEEAHALTILELCHQKLDTAIATQIHTLATIYFGPTQATRTQATCVERATENRHTFNTLTLIETYVRKLNNKNLAWRMRKELCAHPPHIRTLRTRARELLTTYNGPERITNKHSVHASAIPGSTFARLRIDAPGHEIKAALDTLNRAENPALTAIQLLTDRSHHPGDKPPITPAVIIPLPDTTRISRGQGDDIILSLTNGTRMTGREFVQAKLTEAGLAMLVHPKKGPVNLYDTDRSPNPKQRMMAKLENPVCAAEGCGVGADSCQIHHIVAWKNSGHTNIGNLCCLCSFHNGRNDDDRAQPRYGHVDRINGQVHHVPAFGGPPVLNDHPVARGGAMRFS